MGSRNKSEHTLEKRAANAREKKRKRQKEEDDAKQIRLLRSIERDIEGDYE